MTHAIDYEWEKYVLDVIRLHTRTDKTGKHTSDLTKRRLEQIISEDNAHRGLIHPGRGRIDHLLKQLVKKGLVEIRVDGTPVRNFEMIDRGKKWEIVATELSDTLKNKVRIVRVKVHLLDEMTSGLESISRTHKFTVRDFVTYVKLKNEVLSYPFAILGESISLSDSTIEELIYDISKSARKLLERLKKVKINQSKHFAYFDEIVSRIEKRIEFKIEQICYELTDDQSLQNIRAREKLSNSLETNHDRLYYLINNNVSKLAT